MTIKHTLFLRGILPSARLRPGLESVDGTQQAAIAAVEPIEKKDGFKEGEGEASILESGKSQGDKDNALRVNDETQHVNELQAAAEAISERLGVHKRYKAALEEVADRLEATLPEGGVDETTAGLVQSALGASEVPEMADVVAVESFGMCRVTATANLATTLRSRAAAVGKVIDRFQRTVMA